MKFHVIDRENWERKPYFEHYLTQKCTFSLTANIDITILLEQLCQRKLKFYPAYLYMISKTVNAHIEFRTCFNGEILGYWDEMLPCYTIFHQDDKTFSAIWTEYSDDFCMFYKNYESDRKEYGNRQGLFTKEGMPPNGFPVSIVPWTSFTSFNLNINGNDDFLLPIVTGGKYFQQDKKTYLPLSLQVHHSVCDGYHASKFIEEFQELANNCQQWLRV
ncbi:type A chloramphenicol O-acetyltransferase [Shimazuella sp. AN120528]|uniref:type A chloramphenicol O-acetyltransferase n=1 Tax=Shimazuella soli TaxID=1892854 RepID=UPI001F0F9D36|nr:type A chloramphenicol O-acetyltransferase [Shimazuella soli]MCH5584093.1 type A chloramphenicol O-acetyltransferase [Shimazuella soli]